MKVDPREISSDFRFVLSSGDNDDYPGCTLNISIFKWNMYWKLPAITNPDLLKIRGQYNYDDYIERRYGIYLFENHFNIMYGRGDANFHRDIHGEEQRWSCFLPWSEWRLVRHSLYGLNGELIWSGGERHSYDEFCRMRESVVPKRVFTFKDFDGEEITATTFIEEREWHRGEKWFKWLSWFSAPKVRRSLDLHFNKEVGPRKGSWKGGTIGHGIEMYPWELHELAFRRYCQSHNMTFEG